MKIYQTEINDGLEGSLKQNSLSLSCSLYGAEMTDKEKVKILASANPNQEDLFYIEAVLASVGWNDNDDVFDSAEIWNARQTPIDKQFNFMHNEKDIIGHITSSKIISDGKILPETTTIEDLPKEYDIVVGSVLYKTWQDPELQTRINQIIAEIVDDKWFVSMECLFSHFDYAIVTPDNQFKSIARNDETSFLTKHLRAYGGKGEYEGYKVGRLLRGFAFSGKGLVDNPANKRSVIFNFSSVSDQETIFQVVANKESRMSFTEDQYKDLEKRLAAAEKAAKEVADKAVSQEIQDYKSKIESLTKANDVFESRIKEVNDKLGIAEEVSSAKTQSAETLSQKVKDLEASLAEKSEALAKIDQEKVAASRLEKFTQREIDQAKAVNLVEKCANMTAETFDALVESFPAKSEFMSDEDKKKAEKEKKAKEAKASADDEAILEELEITEGAALSVDDQKEADVVRSSAASWFGNILQVKGDK